ncbi:MAG: tRNA pseudouridine(55) synthase TruB [Clostridia bacterium]|nr:tRNA pseudouridine(55) synthase TruB [Clostridia bacterium]
MDGIININKPAGFTSHDVVAKLRGILKTKKIGHTGTLDPDAVGVLPICVGKATKVADMLTATEKEYIAEMTLGSKTDTQDASGTVLATAPVTVEEDDIRKVLESFLGEGQQIPPMYSAIKQDGKKLYELARKGIEVERQPRPITIYGIEFLWFHPEEKKCKFRVACSKGTYIRTLCQDIGDALGCFAHMSALCRSQSGRFYLDDAYTLDAIASMVEAENFSFLTPVDKVFEELPPLYLSKRKADLMCHGVQVRTPGICEGTVYRIYRESGEFLSISLAQDGMLKMQKTFY